MNKIEITVQELKELIDGKDEFCLLDVRREEEFSIVNIGGELIPDYDISTQYSKLPKDAYIVVLCHHGVRSLNVTHFLLSKGFERVSSVAGGIDKYAKEIDNTLATY